MHKGIKILGKVLLAIVLTVVLLPFALSLLLGVPAVQNFVVHKAAGEDWLQKMNWWIFII